MDFTKVVRWVVKKPDGTKIPFTVNAKKDRAVAYAEEITGKNWPDLKWLGYKIELTEEPRKDI